MPNDRLRDALANAGITPAELAERLGVDHKTVERWITRNRVPYPRNRSQIAALVRESETYLWPDALSPERVAEASESEIVRVYVNRANVVTDLWSRLFTNVSEQLDILVYSGMFIPDQFPNLPRQLKKKADQGLRVRILLGDPDCYEVQVRGRDEGIGDAMAAKIRNARHFYEPALAHPNIELRSHRTVLYNSIYRFDNEMLVNTHIYGEPAANAPVMHLRRLNSGDLFETYADSFNRIWENPTPAEPGR